jgi:hypothetical protein
MMARKRHVLVVMPIALMAIVIAAGGDTLVLTGDHDQACPTGPNAVHGVGEWIVTRGTGRFAGATGKGTFDGVADFDRGTYGLGR